MVVDHLFEKFVEYCSEEKTRKSLEDKFLLPILQHLGERFRWTLKAFQALTVLVVMQTLLILWLLLRSYKTVATTASLTGL